ncbi:Manganese transport system membrane protein MntB [Rubripirellula obstinata]|uniref:Manganese transport system membrane protein MntB n=1 Tax=Rubripirellula obstinata TaxID=406547 RepID=A0A5B1CJZ1_9BACT|nr:metal ABC transporter permease [Rubripirellula obstinata]KAA1261507.1 Manganese transport system membrane protein MntB [Rubripirellula obstinata]
MIFLLGDWISDWDGSINGWIVVIGCLCAASASLLGNFLVLRRMSMLGDAITHAVLPGIAAAFFISGTRNSMAMFVGAVIVGLLTAVFTEWIRSVGKVDEGASMGVVFTSLFALGLVMLVAAADHVDLDPKCVLYGAIDLTPLDTVWVRGLEIPRAAIVLSIVLVLNLAFVILFFKELKISSFDPALATTMGFSAKAMHYLLMVLVSITAVASFESVGSILVVAMFVVPAAAAYMLTDRLAVMIFFSVIIAVASASLGHIAALEVPTWFGFRSTTTAGPMAVVSGLLFLLAALFGPRYGVVVKWVRRQSLSWRILCDDIVAILYRAEERDTAMPGLAGLADELFASSLSIRSALLMLRRKGEIEGSDQPKLTPRGIDRARELVRSHRLWEQYLVVETGAETNRIHSHAERWEHFTDRPLRDELDRVTEAPDIDPHGSPIPPENKL